MSRTATQIEQLNASRARGDVARRPPGIDKAALQSPLTTLFPPGAVVPFGFLSIAIGATALTVPTGYSAWYGLTRLHVDRDVGQEIGVHGYKLEIAPADPAGTGLGTAFATNALAWGAPITPGAGLGTGAAVVIGLNLPIQRGAWTAARCSAPWVEAITNQTNAWPFTAPHSELWFPFPFGQISTTATLVRAVEHQSPLNWRVGQGSTLDVALVLRGSTISTVANKVIYGYCFGCVFLGLQSARQGYTG